MRTYKEHYEAAKANYNTESSSKYNDVYDLRLDEDIFEKSDKYLELVKKVAEQVNLKINNKEDLQEDDLILFEVDGLFSHFGIFCQDDQVWHHEGGFLSRKSHITQELIDRIHSIYRLDLSVY